MPNYVLNPQQTVGEFLPSVYINKITLRNSVSNPQDLKVELIVTVKDVLTSGNLSKWFSLGTIGTAANPKTLKDYIKINIIQTTTQEAAMRWSHYSNRPQSMYVNTRDVVAGSGAAKKIFSITDFDNGLPLGNQYSEYDANGNSIKNMSLIINTNDFKTDNNDALAPNDNYLSYFVWASFDIAAMALDWRVDANTLILEGQSYSTPFIGKMNSNIVFRNSKLVSQGYIFFEAEKRIGVQGSNSGILRKTNKLWTGPVFYRNVTIDGQNLQLPMGGRQYNAAAHAAGQQPWLVRQTIPYRKVQDFRNINRLNKLKFDFSIIENELLRTLTQDRGGIVPENQFAYFTNIFLSRDQNNNCRFLFGIDLPKMVRENSPYSRLFLATNQKSPWWLARIMNKIQIISMKIYRKRTVGSSEVGTSPYYYPGDHRFDPVPKLKKFDNGLTRLTRNITNHLTTYDPSEEFIICGGEKPNAAGNGFSFNSYSEDGGSNIRFLTNGIANRGAVATSAAGGKMYYFTGTDAKMSENTDGYYQYKIEIEIQDNVVDFLIEQRTRLLDSRKRLQEYYSIATSTNGKETNQRLKDLGIAMIDPEPPPFFNPTTNRFTQAFMTTPIAAQHGNRADDINNYIRILKMFVNLRADTAADKGDEADIRAALKNYIRPQSGNPEGILVVLNLYESLISFLNQAIGIRKQKPSERTAGVDAGMQTDPGTASSVLRTFKIEHTFEDYFDANIPVNYGFDFLGAGYNSPSTNPLIPSAMGLRVINADTYENSIVANELKKIFNSTTAPFELRAMKREKGINAGTDLRNTDFTFLTPAVVYPGVNSTPLALVGKGTDAAPNVNDATFMNMAAGFLSRNYGNQVLHPTNTLQETVADFLSYNYNLTAVPDPEPQITLNDPGTNLTEQFSSTPNEDYYASSNAQTRENQYAFDVFWNLISNGVVSAGNRAGVKLPEGSSQKPVDYYSVTNTNGFWNAFESSFPSDDPNTHLTKEGQMARAAKNLPNPIKALIRYNDEQTLQAVQLTPGTDALKSEIDTFLGNDPFRRASLSAKARILFDTIGQIEYLNEFGRISPRPGSQEKSANMDRWLPLNRQVFSTYSIGYPLLCRIRPWENVIFKTERQEGSNLPTYEEYFLLVEGSIDLPDNLRVEAAAYYTAGGSQTDPDSPEVDYQDNIAEEAIPDYADSSSDGDGVPDDYSENSDYEDTSDGQSGGVGDDGGQGAGQGDGGDAYGDDNDAAAAAAAEQQRQQEEARLRLAQDQARQQQQAAAIAAAAAAAAEQARLRRLEEQRRRAAEIQAAANAAKGMGIGTS